MQLPDTDMSYVEDCLQTVQSVRLFCEPDGPCLHSEPRAGQRREQATFIATNITLLFLQ